MPTCIDKRLIADEVLGIQRRHRKGVGQIVKGKGKAFSSSSTILSRSQSQVEQQCCIDERFDVQEREIEALKALMA